MAEEKDDTICFVPPWAGRIVGIAEHRGGILVACEDGVFRLCDGRFEPVRFVDDPPEKTA